MTQLGVIQKDVQEIAEAISSAMGIETEIVDNEYTVVAGTGKYRGLIGRKEASYSEPGYLYRTISTTGEAAVVGCL